MIQYLYLGRVDYAEALRLQEELIALRQQGRIGNVLLLLEHPPVLTLGRNARRSNILAPDELLRSRGVTLHEINRGGDVTYHGPGQLIGYPIFDLRSLRSPSGNRLGPVDFVRLMEEALIRLCGDFSVPAGRICGLTGVWCHPGHAGRNAFDVSHATSANQNEPRPEAKIAAIGIHVARGVTSHGFAFNVTTDLGDFGLINPCGITDRAVTSLEKEIERDGAATLPSLESIAHQAAGHFGQVLNEPVFALKDLASLRAQVQNTPAESAEPPAPEFPAQDTPLQIPREIERLRRSKDRPVNA